MSSMGEFQKQFEELFSTAESTKEYLKQSEGLKKRLEDEIVELQNKIFNKREEYDLLIKSKDAELKDIRESFERTRISEMARIKEKEDRLDAMLKENESLKADLKQQIGQALNQEKSFIDISANLEQERQKVNNESIRLEALNNSLIQKDIQLRAKDKLLKTFEASLLERELQLDEIAKEIKARGEANQALANDIDAKCADVQKFKNELDEGWLALKSDQLDLDKRRLELDIRNKTLNDKEKNLKDKEANLENYQRELEFELAKFKKMKDSQIPKR